MQNIDNWSTAFSKSFYELFNIMLETLPLIFGAILVFILGRWLAKLISKGIARFLKAVKFNDLASKVNFDSLLSKGNIKLSPSEFAGKMVYWLLLLFVIMTSADILGWQALTKEVSNLIAYLPEVIKAIVFFIVGIYIITFVRDLIAGASASLGISAGKIISNIVYYLLLIIVALTSLSQLGIDTYIISSNLLLIIGSMLLTASISYGIASREVLTNLIGGYFIKSTYKPGMTIEVNGVKGVIISCSNINVKIQEEGGDFSVIPSKHLISEQVKILAQS